MSCLPPENMSSSFFADDDAAREPGSYQIRLMERAITAVDTKERAILVALTSSRSTSAPPGLLLSEKETATLILSLQQALRHCRMLPLDADTK